MAGVILGISPGTRSTGLAVLSSGSLQDWNVHTFPGKWSGQKLRVIVKTIEAAIRHNGISQVSVKVPDVFPVTKGYNQLIGCINVLCERKNIRPVYYTLSDLKLECARDGKITMPEFLDSVMLAYPELYREYRKEKRNLNAYYYRMFEAVAAAHITSRKLQP